MESRELTHQRWSVVEIQNPGAAGPPGDGQPQRMLDDLFGDALDVPRAGVLAHALAAIAFGETFDGEKQVGPHRLRAEVAAPHASGESIHQEQAERGQDHQSGDVIDFLRPDLDEEKIEPVVFEVDEHRLVRRARSAIPPDKRQEVVDAERDGENDPLDPAERARHALRIDLLARFIQRAVFRGRGAPRNECGRGDALPGLLFVNS